MYGSNDIQGACCAMDSDLTGIGGQHQMNDRDIFIKALKINYLGLASQLALILGHSPSALNDVWQKIGGDINELKDAIIKGAKETAIAGSHFDCIKEIQSTVAVLKQREATIRTEEEKQALLADANAAITKFRNCMESYGWKDEGLFASFSSALSSIAKIVIPAAAAAAAVIPAISSITPAITNTAKTIQTVATTANSLQQLQVMPEPKFSSSQQPPASGSYYSPVGFVFKSLLLISIYNFNPAVTNIICSCIVTAMVVVYGLRKFNFKLWQISQLI